MSHEAIACLSLGLPANVSHIVDEDSPLHDLSVEMMASRKMEVLCCALPLRPCGHRCLIAAESQA